MKKAKQIMSAWLLFFVNFECICAQIELKGVVRDAGNSEAMAFVNVVLQTPDSAFVTGMTTDSNGKFAILNIKPGDYRLAVSYVGYVTQYIGLEGLKSSVTLPEIGMEEETVALSAVTVTASAVTNRIDRKLVFPTEKQINASSNGVDLLQQLMLPRLQVNSITQEIGIPGGGEVQLRINGVKVEIYDIAALQPQDVIRVEYHDNPGLRYGNAAAVVDYIVRRHETGGNLGVNILNAFELEKYGVNYITGQINHKKSEFSFSYYANFRSADQMWRDNEETFRFADGSILRRKEAGEPGKLQNMGNFLNAKYNYMTEKRMLNINLRHYIINLYHLDYVGQLYNMDTPGDYVQMFDSESGQTTLPAIDLYYQENLENDRTLAVNLVGTGNYTDNNRIYRESRGETFLTDIDNHVTGNKYSLIGEGIYEKKLGDNRLSAGLRHTQAYSDNSYRNGHEYRTEMQQGESYLYGEWTGKAEKLNYTLGAGVTRSYFRQKNAGSSYVNYTFNPRLSLFYPLTGISSLRLTSGIQNNAPSLSSLSAVDMTVDSLQIQRGNPGLKPFLTCNSELYYEWRKRIFYAGLSGNYIYKPSAIMEEKFMENDRIIQTWDNQRNWQKASATLNLRVGPVKDILTASIYAGLNHYVSNGNSYRHVYNNPFCTFTLTGAYKNFNAMFSWQKSYDNFEGETMFGGENIHIVSLGYKYKAMNFGLVCQSPFYNSYYMDTENKSSHASYKRRLYINDTAQMMIFKFAYNFSFGRVSQSGQKRLNNADEDAGVMKAGK